MKHKVLYIYGAIFFVCTLVVCLVLNNAKNPNDDIVGLWKEVAWKYEKTPSHYTLDFSNEDKQVITENMMIHKAEVWEFMPNGEIKLTQENGDVKLLNWRLKGRGHVLKLIENNVNNEHYNLYYVGENILELHFRTDLQAKGIVKLTFKRINKTEEYAQKI
ncbi:hypothetical protein AXE80_04815 [Wenyingzhuangia fucanilytica]|uniref:Lipocalin-like domain-containing protein n=1 Tax=Wenyingzhuangia fucanilytica TaxID=1790137 RepID=A0A1B1Y4F8_9FLAO|nr:hypothetical protein [Wenyingzhuangia fucanilytica]ANW95640.1 hypothetical protein AXE80_04815 [Wenyingzhuangia fucanilytica]